MHPELTGGSRKLAFAVLISVLFSCVAIQSWAGPTEVTGKVSDGNGGPWTVSGSPYIARGDVLVPEGETLTIHPGVEVRFDQGKGLNVDGILKAYGRRDALITFTSNGQQAANVWAGIFLRKKSSSVFDYCRIIYGGSLYEQAVHCAEESSVVISSSEIGYTSIGVYLRDTCSVRVFNSTISNVDWPVHWWHPASRLLDFSGNNLVSNKYYGIRLGDPTGGFQVSGKQILRKFHAAPAYSAGNIQVLEGGTLTIEPGVVIKFDEGQASGLSAYGTMIARGTSCDPIIFTSIRDDIVGDTNGDGSNSVPTKSLWNTVGFYGSSASVMDYCKVYYASSWYKAAISCRDNSRPTISNCDIARSEYHGIEIQGAATPTIGPNNLFWDLTAAGGYGVWSRGTNTVNAINNYWGDASGPNHPKLNPNGKGFGVSDGVNFQPYLQKMPSRANTLCLSILASSCGYIC